MSATRLQKLLQLLDSEARGGGEGGRPRDRGPRPTPHSPAQTRVFCCTAAGNSDGTRKAAGRQIVDVARAHPAQLLSITRKARPAARSAACATRRRTQRPPADAGGAGAPSESLAELRQRGAGQAGRGAARANGVPRVPPPPAAPRAGACIPLQQALGHARRRGGHARGARGRVPPPHSSRHRRRRGHGRVGGRRGRGRGGRAGAGAAQGRGGGLRRRRAVGGLPYV